MNTTIKTPEVPIADFKIEETTKKRHGGGSGHLQLDLCKADFDYLCKKKFNTGIGVRNLTVNSGYGRRETIAVRVMRIIIEQRGKCEIVCNLKKNKSRISAEVRNVATTPDKKLVYFEVFKDL